MASISFILGAFLSKRFYNCRTSRNGDSRQDYLRVWHHLSSPRNLCPNEYEASQSRAPIELEDKSHTADPIAPMISSIAAVYIPLHGISTMFYRYTIDTQVFSMLNSIFNMEEWRFQSQPIPRILRALCPLRLRLLFQVIQSTTSRY